MAISTHQTPPDFRLLFYNYKNYKLIIVLRFGSLNPQESAPVGDWVALFFEADQSASVLDKKKYAHLIRPRQSSIQSIILSDFEVKYGDDWYLAKLIHQSDTKKKCEQALDVFLEKKVSDHNASAAEEGEEEEEKEEKEEEEGKANNGERQGSNSSNLSTNLIHVFERNFAAAPITKCCFCCQVQAESLALALASRAPLVPPRCRAT
jgi:hypothetical protein